MADENLGIRSRGKRGKRGKRGHRGKTGPTGSTLPPLLATAFVNSNVPSFRSETGFSSVTNPIAGTFVLTLANPPASTDNLVVVLGLFGTLGGQILYAFIGSTIQVSTFNAAGTVFVNSDFSIAVFDLS